MNERHVIDVLESYDVDPTRGFLPELDPETRLPEAFTSWERLAIDLPALLSTGGVRDAVDDLPLLDADALDATRSLQRAMLLLSVFASASVFGGTEPDLRLPRNLCLPWKTVSTRLGRPMIIAHASIVLHNWRRIDMHGPIAADNLRTLQCFRGGPDEEWFYLLTAEIEATGAAALPALARLRCAVDAEKWDDLDEDLEQVSATIDSMRGVLDRMEERCRHAVFYHRIRPFLSGWPEPGVVYEGLEPAPQVLHGGSAAQSSLLNAFDAVLDVPHEHPRTRPFLQAMRRYMPPRHREFLEWLESGDSLRDAVASRSGGASRYDECIRQLVLFRKAHQEITIRYITRQAPPRSDAVGTGGTEYADFLRRTRIETDRRRLE